MICKIWKGIQLIRIYFLRRYNRQASWWQTHSWQSFQSAPHNHSRLIYEPCHEKTCLWDFRPGKTQTGRLNYRDKLDAWAFAYRNYRYYTIKAANNNGAEQTARVRRLICIFVVCIRQEYKNLTWVWGADRKFRPKGHCLASRVFAEWCKTVIPRDRIFYPPTHSCLILFLTYL